MMKAVMRVLVSLSLGVSPFVLVALAKWSVDLSSWSEESRFALGVGSVFISYMAYFSPEWKDWQ